MKHVVATVFCTMFLVRIAGAQFTLEHTYPNGGTGNTPNNELFLVEFETIEPMYVLLDRGANLLSLYDLDHSPAGSYDLTVAPSPPNTLAYDVLYVSQHLFDMDDGIEVMVVSYSQVAGNTSILDDDGTAMHTFYDEWPRINASVPQDQRPVYNTPNGTKLILSSVNSTYANVYSLPGTLIVGMEDSPVLTSYATKVRVFPNPTNDQLVIQCKTPFSGAGELRIISAEGSVVLSRSLVMGMDSVDVGHLVSGEYLYAISYEGRPVATGKFIKQ